METARVTQILANLVEGQDSSLPDRLCAQCLSALPVSGVAAALMTADGPSGVVLAATDSPARQLEELQFSLGEGPCVEAFRSGRPVFQPELAATGSTRWPGFVAAALDAGIGAIFAFPLRVGAIHVGVLDLYRDTPGHLSITQLADALAFAEAATMVVLHLQDHDAESSALTAAVDGRAEVHQATGMITIQLGVSLAEALLRLRAYAYATGRPVADVAADVVSRRLRMAEREARGERR